MSIDARPTFNDDGLLTGIRIVVERDIHPPIQFTIQPGDVDLSLDANGEIMSKTAIRSHLRAKYRALVQDYQEAKAIQDAKDAVYMQRKQKINFIVSLGDL